MDGSKINTNKITTIKFGIDAIDFKYTLHNRIDTSTEESEIAPYTTPIKISNIAATTPINNEI